MNYRTLILAFFLLAMFSCGKEASTAKRKFTLHDLDQWQGALEEAIVRDGFSPPVASRIYACSSMGFYAALQPGGEGYPAAGKLRPGFPDIPAETDTTAAALRAFYCYYHIGINLVYTDSILIRHLAQWEKQLAADGCKEELLEKARRDGKEIADKIIAWYAEDGYKKTRSMPGYTLSKEPGAWKPTPPDYLDALEPNWPTLRPHLIDSPGAFIYPGPIAYSTQKSSDFGRQLDEVYQHSKNLTDEEKLIASHWDDNAVVSFHDGHAMSMEKKLTPPGHWMNVARSMARINKYNLHQGARLYAALSMAIADAILVTWKAKYRYQSVRPITEIVRLYEPEWTSYLQTPPFPEYPSGHSTISGAAATILTHFVGDNIAFTDSAEAPYGYPPRPFPSFKAAAAEASVSRFHGGIHFMKALDDGLAMGEQVAAVHISKWK